MTAYFRGGQVSSQLPGCLNSVRVHKTLYKTSGYVLSTGFLFQKLAYSCLNLPSGCSTVIAFICSLDVCFHHQQVYCHLPIAWHISRQENFCARYYFWPTFKTSPYLSGFDAVEKFLPVLLIDLLNSSEHHKHPSFYELSSAIGMCTHSVTGFTRGKSDFQLLHLLCVLLISAYQGRSWGPKLVP